jgi:hypothetical protein
MTTTGFDPAKLRRRYRIAYLVLYVVGGLTLLLGLATVLFRLNSAGGVGNGLVTIGQGVVVLVFGYFTMRGSLMALGIAIGWYGLESILTVAVIGIQAVPIRAVVLFFLVQGFLALRLLKQQETLDAGSSAPSSDPPPPAAPTTV